jgi:flagellar motor switch protein FliG
MLTLSGPQRAAVVFAQLDDQHAHNLLKMLSEKETVRLLGELAQLPAVSVDDVDSVMSAFVTQTAAYRHVRQGGVGVARHWLEARLGPARATEVLTEIETLRVAKPLDFLHGVEPWQIAEFLVDEHPQAAALVLANIDSEQAGRVLDRFGEDRASDIVQRIATMGPVPPAVVQQVADTFERRISTLLRSGGGEHASGGVATAAAVLNNVDWTSEQGVLTRIEANNPDLAEQLRDQMFVFDDVLALDDVALQVVLRAVTLRDMALAIKGAGLDVAEKFIRNLSERSAADLEEELQSLGPQRVSAINAAQNVVVKVARDLAESGAISIARSTDEIVV